MARVPMVTRTIVTTKAVVLCMDLQEQTPVTAEVVLPRTYKDDKVMMKQISKILDNDKIKAVHVQTSEEVETLYGMTEQEFINSAKLLDPETRKQLEEEPEQ